ncbi:hypothetical protein BC833DRAFT_568854 [Globomyces pollinis-pini]|nr:hypothetical protein BC833DRAFT_568854 [Globomyces pollinis-pini]
MGNSNSAGPWNPVDDYTWGISGLYALFWVGYLVVELVARFKVNALWITVAIAIPLNVIKCLIIVIYSYLLMQMQLESAVQLLKWYYITSGAVALTQHAAMYQRKHTLIPERYYLDELILVVLACITTYGELYCVMFTDPKCWLVESNMVFASNMLSLVYFDVYYCVYISTMYKNQSGLKDRIKILLPCYWTLFNTLACGVGVLKFSFGSATFYSNALWNLSYMIMPLVAIQSNISTSVQSFVLSASKKPKSISRIRPSKRSTIPSRMHYGKFEFFWALESGQSEFKDRIKILIPCYWTMFNTLVYGIGVLTYTFGYATFFSNSYWNLSCMILPMLAIQSNISTHVQSFKRTTIASARRARVTE